MAGISIAVCMGIPGSGKTYFCRNILNWDSTESSSHNNTSAMLESYHFIHVSYDSIIPLQKQQEIYRQASSDFYDGIWKQERENVYKNVANLVSKLKCSPVNVSDLIRFLESCCFSYKFSSNEAKKFVILLDDNFYYRSMRQQFHKLSFKEKIGFCQLHFECSLEAAIENNENRDGDQRIPNEVISNMHDRLQKPSLDSTWEANTLTVHHSQSDVPKLFIHLINTSILQPADTAEKEHQRSKQKEEAEESRLTCSKSFIHKCDIFLRGFVSDCLKECAAEKKSVARAANLARQSVLSELRGGSVVFDENIVKYQSSDVGAIDQLRNELLELFNEKFHELNT